MMRNFDGPVCIVAEKFQSRRDQSNFMRRLARLRENGATAILVQVDPDHRLVGDGFFEWVRRECKRGVNLILAM